MQDLTKNKRLNEIIEAVMDVARGNYSIQIGLSEGNDEIDALAMGLNMMIDDLRNNVELEKTNKAIRAINEELVVAKEKAQESDRLKSAFLANMSHGIRTPLNAIIGFTDLLKKDSSDPEKNEKFLNYIEKAGEQLLALINDLLDISRIESDQLSINNEEFVIKDLLDQVVEIASQSEHFKSKPDLELIVKPYDTTKACTIATDQVRFKQIVINLVVNAIKFTEKGSIEIGWSPKLEGQKTFVELYVKDTGIGIPDHSQEKIFDRFVQLNPGMHPDGTGLGLAICKGLADKLGGSIRLESSTGKGSVFYVNFPCDKEALNLVTENRNRDE